MTYTTDYHIPVLLAESVDLMEPQEAGVYVDVTFGGGGHSREILRRLGADCGGRLVAFDQDRDALSNAPDDPRFLLINNNFRFMRGCLRAVGVRDGGVDGVLADLGVSSHHFDTAERGFSFRFDAPLDMRMNQNAKLSAREVVNTYSAERLATIFGRYGELDKCFRVANAIVAGREVSTIETIGELLQAVESCTPRGGESKFRAKLFQAIRIEVNGEMRALEMMLEQALSMLRVGGVLSVITYHSLEDRMVKNFMRSGNFEGTIEKDFYGRTLSPFELVNRKVIEASAAEVEANPRSRSAKLRAARRII